MSQETTDPTPVEPADAPTPVEATVRPEVHEPVSIVDIPIAPEDEVFDPALPDPMPAPMPDPVPAPDSVQVEAPEPDLEPTAPLTTPGRDPLAPPPPEPTARFLPSEIAGMVAGVIMFALAIWYCLKVL